MDVSQWRKSRVKRAGVVLAGAAILALAVAGVARGDDGGTAPRAEVLPSPIGVNYGQTVQVKGYNLPKGSGSIAVTICGLEDAAGTKIETAGADDCAGAAELQSGLVKLQKNEDGNFDQQYTLPASGQTFGKNVRSCDATHHCAVVVADANPESPAYHIDTVLQFVDQQPFGGAPSTPAADATTTTTAPPPPSATADKSEMRVGETVNVTGLDWMASDPDTTAGFVDANGAATSDAMTATVDSSGHVTAALVATNNDIDATSIVVNDATSDDPTTHRIALAITVKPQVGVTGHATAHAHVSPQGAQVQAEPQVWVELPPGGEALPIPDPAKDAVTQLCDQMAQSISDAGGDPIAITTACGSILNGGGGQTLQMLLETPSLLCIAAAPAAQNDPGFIEVCNQVVDGAQPGTAQAGAVLKPVTDRLP